MRYSPSALNMFAQCPAKYKYEKLDHVQPIYVERAKADVGHDVHHAIQYYFSKVQEKPRRIELTEGIKRAWDEIVGNKYKSNRILQHRVTQSLKNFTEFEIMRRKTWKSYLPSMVEKPLQGKEFRGIVDFYSEKEQVVIDWKTGKKNELSLDDYRQGEIYRKLLEEEGKKVSRVLFVVLSTGKVLSVPTLSDGWLGQEIIKIKSSISNGNFPKKPSMLCGYCPYVIRCEMEGIGLWATTHE